MPEERCERLACVRRRWLKRAHSEAEATFLSAHKGGRSDGSTGCKNDFAAIWHSVSSFDAQWQTRRPALGWPIGGVQSDDGSQAGNVTCLRRE